MDLENLQHETRVVVLAAGKGKRLQSENHDLPKVLRRAAGRALLSWVLDKLDFVRSKDVIIVVGYKAELVKSEIGSEYSYALQSEQLGTGHAVAAAAPLLHDFSGDVLVVYGDMPLFKPGTYRDLVEKHKASGADCTMLTAIAENIPDYGRILRDEQGGFVGIVEKKDCTAAQLRIREVNPGVYVFRSQILLTMLQQLRNNNAQGEYYLTDVPSLMQQAGCRISTFTISDEREVLGVNTEKDLKQAEEILLGAEL